MSEAKGNYVIDGQTTDQFGENINFYADWVKSEAHRTGLNIQCVLSRAGFPTLNIELAPIPKPSATPAWGEKITLQLTSKELFAAGAVILGVLPSCIGSYHGSSKNKGFSIFDNMDRGVAISLTEGGKSLGHLVSPDQRIELAAFVVRRISDALKVSVAEVLTMMPMVYRDYGPQKKKGGSHE